MADSVFTVFAVNAVHKVHLQLRVTALDAA